MAVARGSAKVEAQDSSDRAHALEASAQELEEPAVYPMELEQQAAEEGEGEAMELDEKEDEEDCAPVRLAPDPGAPTAEEVENHRTTHLPYRSWCEDCVKGRGSGERHRSGPAGRVPVIACDYLIVTGRGI